MPQMRAQRRGLAGAVGAEERRDAAFVDREVDAVQHLRRRRSARMQAARASSERRRHARRRPGRRGSRPGCAAPRPACRRRSCVPKSSATTRSETLITRFMWCSTSSIGELELGRGCADQLPISASTSSWLRPPAGSSSSSSFGSARERARQLDALLRAERQVGDRRVARPRSSSSRREQLARACRAMRRSSRRTRGRRSALAKKPPRVRQWRADHARSRARSCVRNSARFWNVRPMPSAAMPCARRARASDRPSKRIAPSLNA